MPNIQDMMPLYFKTMPFFFLVELPREPGLRQNVAAFLPLLLGRIHTLLTERQGYPLFVGIYPFGEDCCAEPLFPETCTDFDAAALNGSCRVSLGDRLQLLNRHLSRHGKLDFPVAPGMPTLFLFSSGRVTQPDRDGLLALQKNNWFRHSRRECICLGAAAEEEFLWSFRSGNTPLAQLPQSPALFDEFLDTLLHKPVQSRQQSALMGSLENTDGDDASIVSSLEDLVRVDPLIPEEEDPPEMPAGYMLMGEAVPDPERDFFDLGNAPDDWD